MKTIKIKDASFKVIEMTKRTKKAKSVEITITYEDGNSYSRIVKDLDKYQFQYRIPFTMKQIAFSNFKNVSIEKQDDALVNMCKDLINKEVFVGNIGSRYIDLEVETTIIKNLQVGKDLYMVPSYFYFGNDFLEMYDDDCNLTPNGEKIKQIYSLTLTK